MLKKTTSKATGTPSVQQTDTKLNPVVPLLQSSKFRLACVNGGAFLHIGYTSSADTSLFQTYLARGQLPMTAGRAEMLCVSCA